MTPSKYIFILPVIMAVCALPLLRFFQFSTSQHTAPECRCLPTDDCWPARDEWSRLNISIHGRLIATSPLGARCHTPSYDPDVCARLKESWIWPKDHVLSPSSLMSPYWQNGTCSPFSPINTTCNFAHEVQYSINVSAVSDIVVGLLFARENNIRILIKNTGHDYMGRSSGIGALGFWTHNMKSIDHLDYTSTYYNGSALRFGAGVSGFEAYSFANKHGLQVVGGFCPTVGIVGGYTQGGGHSSMSSTHGLGADQALEWEVVTVDGEHLIASPTQNADLYWALCGGGGGTYGVVISLTVKVYPDGNIGGASLSFSSVGIERSDFWKIFQTWQQSLPVLVDTGATAGYALLKDVIPNEILFVDTITAPGSTENEVEKLLEPTISILKSLDVKYTLSVTSSPSYLSHFETYFGPLPNGIYTIHHLFAGRIIPRSVVQKKNVELSRVIENITENSNAFLGFVALNVSQTASRNAVAQNAVLPAWREAIITVLAQSTWSFENSRDHGAARANELTYEVVPQLTKLTGASGSYMNEADFQLQTWKEDFFGSNYDRLLDVKNRYDPDGILFARSSVGSDAWKLEDDGRLCRV